MKLRYVEITIEWLDTIFDNQAYLYISVDTFYPSLSTNLTRLINQFHFIYFDYLIIQEWIALRYTTHEKWALVINQGEY